MDAECPGTSLCIGIDDNLNMFCKVPSMPFVCMNDGECGGFGKCVAGDCKCETDADCTSAFADTCLK